MAPVRACRQCKTAKAKCDLTSPTCGRCSRRDLTCSGPAQAQPGFTFLSENKVAQRNSVLARRPRASGRGTPMAIRSPPQLMANLDLVEVPVEQLQQFYYWLTDAALAEVPGPLKRSIEARAIERFFLNWTLNPTNDGVAPGYMYDLPELYAGAAPGSVLWHAVRAVAFAELKGFDGGSFILQARQDYGGALTRMRSIAEDNTKWAEDRILAALLLIDHFETIYLSRLQPLGPHKDALVHALNMRGEEHSRARPRFELWRTAMMRLQATQIVRREKPFDWQLAWISKLNTSLPDVHVCVDVMRMVILCAAARKFMAEGRTEEVEEAARLTRTMEDVIESMEAWSNQVAEAWRSESMRPVDTTDSEASRLLLALPRLPVLHYNDPWLAYKWNFHVASQIVLRESMSEMLERCDLSPQSSVRTQQHAEAVVALAGEIIASLPPLLSLADKQSYKKGQREPQGKMAGRYFAVFALRVVERARFALPEQKMTVTRVLDWLHAVHGLE
ncbi:uncharacterized protein LTR77_008302 [Saxophila tyrrhenica]|uniref:Zn(2)-C6 fungal-type domain-containing protein n=1 Tax=Saxophila tyrrhenica TaxID=1690608 RepID=A0AAV9P0Z9_9PEZI|nr:hypothetical protein LTR77_008302 [Saxophila tyrrhenica]